MVVRVIEQCNGPKSYNIDFGWWPWPRTEHGKHGDCTLNLITWYLCRVIVRFTMGSNDT